MAILLFHQHHVTTIVIFLLGDPRSASVPSCFEDIIAKGQTSTMQIRWSIVCVIRGQLSSQPNQPPPAESVANSSRSSSSSFTANYLLIPLLGYYCVLRMMCKIGYKIHFYFKGHHESPPIYSANFLQVISRCSDNYCCPVIS